MVDHDPTVHRVSKPDPCVMCLQLHSNPAGPQTTRAEFRCSWFQCVGRAHCMCALPSAGLRGDVAMYDISDPALPKFVTRLWLGGAIRKGGPVKVIPLGPLTACRVAEIVVGFRNRCSAVFVWLAL